MTEKGTWISGTFIEIEYYENFTPLSGRALIDENGNIIDVVIGYLGLIDLEDGLYMVFKDKNGEVYET